MAGDAEHLALLEKVADQVDADRKAEAVHADRHADGGHSHDAGRYGEDVGQVHFERVVHLVADAEGREGRGRPEDHIDLLERLVRTVDVALGQRT